MELTEGTPLSTSDDALLALFHQHPVEAAQCVTELRARIIELLRAKGCTNPEDIWGATVLIVLQKSLMPGDVENLEGFFWRIAFRTFLNQRHRARDEISLEDAPVSVLAVCPNLRDHTFFEHLRACLEQLSHAEYALITAESLGEDREEIAKRLHVPRGTLRQRLRRARAKLYDCLERRGVAVNIEAGNI